MNVKLKGKPVAWVILLSIVFCLLGPGLASAYDDVTRERSEIAQMSRKLGRGIINIFTGWMEIPKTIGIKWRETDPATGTALGFIQGIAWGFARTASGFYETFTFPFPAPKNYEPLLEPEFILPTIWGEHYPITELDYDR